MDLFPAHDRVQVLLPELSDESKAASVVIEIDQELHSKILP